jgi:two-component system, cell cycle response regulator
VAGGDAFWVCVPAALLLSASAPSAAGALGAAVLTVVASSAPGLAGLAGNRPALILALLVTGASVAVLQAVRARYELERSALRTSALTDPLTRVLNRRGFGERVEYEIARHSRLQHRFVVVAVDLDGFKLINDRYGHEAGDEVLEDVAYALRAVVRDQDTVARLGGDEFCVLAPETDAAGGEQLAERVREAVARASSGAPGLGASVGVAVYPDHGRTAAAVVQAADTKQVAAKRRSRTGAGRRRSAAA